MNAPHFEADCLFCKIVRGEIPGEVMHEDEHCLVFRDISPQAPSHILLIPKTHIPSLNELSDEHKDLAGQLMLTVGKIAGKLGLTKSGYRLVVNCGDDGGQTVGHLHLHVLGGRQMQWPPG